MWSKPGGDDSQWTIATLLLELMDRVLTGVRLLLRQKGWITATIRINMVVMVLFV